MNKIRLKTWKEARGELLKAAGEDVCAEFDKALAMGRKVTAIKLLRDNGIKVESDH